MFTLSGHIPCGSASALPEEADGKKTTERIPNQIAVMDSKSVNMHSLYEIIEITLAEVVIQFDIN